MEQVQVLTLYENIYGGQSCEPGSEDMNKTYGLVGYLEEMGSLMAEYLSKNVSSPTHLILSMEYRQAIRVSLAKSLGKEVYDVPEITEYLGINIIKKENVIVVE